MKYGVFSPQRAMFTHLLRPRAQNLLQVGADVDVRGKEFFDKCPITRKNKNTQ